MAKENNLLWIIILVVAALFMLEYSSLFNIAGTENLLKIDSLDYSMATGQINNTQINILSTVLGSHIGLGTQGVCNNNDGDIQLSNSYEIVGNKGTFISDIRNVPERGNPGCRNNGLIANMSLSNKKITYNCEVSSYAEHSHGFENPTRCIIEINGNRVVLINSPTGDGTQTNDNQSGQIIVTNETFIELAVFSTMENGDNIHNTYGTAKLTILLEDYNPQQTSNQTNQTNQTQQNGTVIIYQNITSNQTIIEYVKPTLKEKYGLAGIIFIILGGVILWLLIKGRKK